MREAVKIIGVRNEAEAASLFSDADALIQLGCRPDTLAKAPRVKRVLPDRFSQQRLVEIVERTTDVEFDTPVVLPASFTGHSDRLHGGLLRSISVRVRMKEPFELAIDPRLHELLSDPISDSGYS
jgi:hypothetical protein